MLTVYLAGPIEGCTLEEATCWREDLEDYFCSCGIETLNPMRGKEAIVESGETIVKPNYNPKLAYLCKDDSVYRRDLLMIDKSDVVLVNLTGSNAMMKGIGTFVEIGYAAKAGKCIVVVSEARHVLEHPFINGDCVRFTSMDDAVAFISTVSF